MSDGKSCVFISDTNSREDQHNGKMLCTLYTISPGLFVGETVTWDDVAWLPDILTIEKLGLCWVEFVFSSRLMSMACNWCHFLFPAVSLSVPSWVTFTFHLCQFYFISIKCICFQQFSYICVSAWMAHVNMSQWYIAVNQIFSSSFCCYVRNLLFCLKNGLTQMCSFPFPV